MSCKAEPLKAQSRYLLNTLLTHSVWTREERLAALPGITHSELCSHARALLDRHALEALYYGNLSKAEALGLTEQLLAARAEYLASRAAVLGAQQQQQVGLQDWFCDDPVERVVRLESAVLARQQELNKR